jgi:UDP-N-acetylmuramate: L-alanyl-gamma-D-glutamyl-meso-diaminopimelate ligase
MNICPYIFSILFTVHPESDHNSIFIGKGWKMRLHILGIGGTFMCGLAVLAKQSGHEVSGSDSNIYPPMSTQLVNQDIKYIESYSPHEIDWENIDCVIVGNVIKRGNPAIEYVLSHHIPYLSGPDWLAQFVLKNRKVLAVAGTHGKTTTSSILAFILQQTGHAPGFLIGGIPENFGRSSSLGQSSYFVIEADEYDSAFFDKRSKFIHYHPDILILNNLEYDHADIFPDLAAIKQQFHYLLKTIPNNGCIIHPAQDEHLLAVINQGCWTPLVTFGQNGEWQAVLLKEDGSNFEILRYGQPVGKVCWSLLGQHNVHNALGAIAAANEIGIEPAQSSAVLAQFKNVKRRLEIKGMINNITIYDDFAHHPTAIAATLAGLRANIGGQSRIVAVLEFGSYTMRQGVHKHQIQAALSDANLVVCKSTETDWGLKDILSQFTQPALLYQDVDALVEGLAPQLQSGDYVVVMSNSGFDNIHHKLLEAIADPVECC